MGWDEGRHAEPEITAGRRILGAAIRRARLRHGLSQRQLGVYVALDQTTISKLETGKLRSLRFRMVCRVIGMISRAGAFELPDVPLRLSRRLPGEAEAMLPIGDHRGRPGDDDDDFDDDDDDDDLDERDVGQGLAGQRPVTGS